MSDKPKHGELGVDEKSHLRWCEVHDQYHGVFYECESYPQEVLNSIRTSSNAFAENLNNPEWVKQQIEKLVSEGSIEEDARMAVRIMRIFAGS